MGMKRGLMLWGRLFFVKTPVDFLNSDIALQQPDYFRDLSDQWFEYLAIKPLFPISFEWFVGRSVSLYDLLKRSVDLRRAVEEFGDVVEAYERSGCPSLQVFVESLRHKQMSLIEGGNKPVKIGQNIRAPVCVSNTKIG